MCWRHRTQEHLRGQAFYLKSRSVDDKPVLQLVDLEEAFQPRRWIITFAEREESVLREGEQHGLPSRQRLGFVGLGF